MTRLPNTETPQRFYTVVQTYQDETTVLRVFTNLELAKKYCEMKWEYINPAIRKAELATEFEFDAIHFTGEF